MNELLDWFSVLERRPPYNAIVYLQFNGREVKGRRGRHPRTGQEVWSEVPRGGPEQLMNLRPEIVETIIWRPQNEKTWDWNGNRPTPVSKPIPGFHWTKQSMSAADMAAEMEAERMAMGAAAGDAEADPFGRWWRGAGLDMRYEAAGAVTREWCEARVMRALAHCEWRRRTGILVSGVEAALAEAEEAALRSMAEYELVHGADLAPRLRPLPSDEADFTIAMGWFTRLNDRPAVPYRLNWPQIVLESRARDERLTWQQIGIRLNRAKPPSPRTCRNYYRRAIDSCLRIANDVGAVDARLEALRERNRAARRQG